MKTIPAGYRLIVTSWENDADNYKTETISGLSESSTRFLIDLYKLFYSKNNPPKGKVCFGNIFEASDSQIDKCVEAAQKIVDLHKDGDHVADVSDNFEDFDSDALFNLLQMGGLAGCSFYTFRVLSDYEVEYFEHPIVINDVTSRF
jgi:hypothetical protein